MKKEKIIAIILAVMCIVNMIFIFTISKQVKEIQDELDSVQEIILLQMEVNDATLGLFNAILR